ncbi:MAG: hypothetical protein KDK96_09575 [Chlamydiia bacterium]|nr:hypothetical protein [Chlamydiia bacterium]
MGKILLLTIILVMATVISIESSEIRSKMVGPVYDSWKCPSCGWENDEDAMRCKICDRYK